MPEPTHERSHCPHDAAPPSASLSTAALIAHIVERYHRPIEAELPRLAALARELAASEPRPLRVAVRNTLAALAEELTLQMRHEERALFPAILAGAPGASFPVQVMYAEHETIDALLAELRRLTAGYTADAAACETQQTLWRGLAALERELYVHMQLEDEVLFPRVATRP